MRTFFEAPGCNICVISGRESRFFALFGAGPPLASSHAMVMFDPVSHQVIAGAIAVHRQFGPGLLESVYAACLAQELLEMGLDVAVEKPMPLEYRGLHIPRAYVLDLVVEERLIVEVKRVERITDVHVAQILTYLRLTGISVGLIINFNVASLRDGIRRIVHTPAAGSPPS